MGEVVKMEAADPLLVTSGTMTGKSNFGGTGRRTGFVFPREFAPAYDTYAYLEHICGGLTGGKA